MVTQLNIPSTSPFLSLYAVLLQDARGRLPSPSAVFHKPRLPLSSSSSSHNLVHPLVLQPPDLLLERLHLLPAVQRLPVVPNQALHHLAAGLLDALGQLAQLLALVQPRPEGLDLLGHGLAAVGAGGVLRGFRARDLGGLLLRRLEGRRLLLLELLELRRDAGLYG